ncbi:hypothetical protein CPC08DRAFT_290610 [Agrocybe pediades]|nr:hypothetical protein CPC08DRAFT_290610 [Agrocybe pediades]
MISSNQVLINGGQFSQHNYHGQKAPIDILKDAVAANASHDSAARFDPPKCHPQTRIRILYKIMGWILGKGSEDTRVKPFMWLNGAAGAGKSAIAQSTVERCMERGLLLASFFFSKSDPTRNHAEPLVATLAYQLYCAFPGTEVQTEILSAIKKDPLIFKKTLNRQFTSLVVQPLKMYLSKHQLPTPQTSFLILIDGLDECMDRASQKAVLSGLADSVCDSNPYIRIFIASRPEYDITLSFDSKHLKDDHARLSLDLGRASDVEADIKLYLSDQFEQIKDNCNNSTMFWPKLDQPWPGEALIKELVRKSSRQFIYAATVIRYMASARPQRPDRSLEIVLNLRPHDGVHPFAELDALYEKILESSKNVEKVLEVLSLEFLEVLTLNITNHKIPGSVNEIEKVLSYDEGEVRTLFFDLGALVQLSEPPGSTLKILHASLQDYLLDKERSKQFHIDLGGKYIGRHMANVLKYLASCGLEYDPYNWRSSLATRAASFFIDHSLELRSCTIPPELQQTAFSFPLAQFLSPHFLSVHVPYHAVDFVVAFLHVLRIMALKDPTCSYIEEHQHRNLDTVIIHPLQRYFDDGEMVLNLTMFYHKGSDRFVPVFDMSSAFVGTSSYDKQQDSSILYDIHDHLRLSPPVKAQSNEPHILEVDGRSTYFDYIRRLLRSVSALSPTIYAKAAKVCLDALPSLPVPPFFWKHKVNADDTEDDPCPYLVFDDDVYSANPQWMFRIPWSDLADKITVDEKQYESLAAVYFTVLGYLIFLLPRCGRWDDLIAACKRQQRLYIRQPNSPFPIRWRRLHMEIDIYLARVLLTLNV